MSHVWCKGCESWAICYGCLFWRGTMTGLNLACVSTTTSMLRSSGSRRPLTSFSASATTFKPTTRTVETSKMPQTPQTPQIMQTMLQIINSKSQLDQQQLLVRKISSSSPKQLRQQMLLKWHQKSLPLYRFNSPLNHNQTTMSMIINCLRCHPI